MKGFLLTIAWLVAWPVFCLSLSSCSQEVPASWSGTPNPLDAPSAVEVEPPANGHFGPFGVAPLSHRNFNGSP